MGGWGGSFFWGGAPFDESFDSKCLVEIFLPTGSVGRVWGVGGLAFGGFTSSNSS